MQLTEAEIEKQRKLNKLDGDLPALKCLNENYDGDLSDLLWDLHYYGELPVAETAFNSLDTDEFKLVCIESLEWSKEKITDKVDRLSDIVLGEINSILDSIDNDELEVSEIARYLKTLRNRSEAEFTEIVETIEKL